MRAFRPLFYTGTITQFLTVPVHFLGMSMKRPPANDKEKILEDLLHNYRFDLGAGFVRSTSDFMMGFGIVYGVFILIFALINLFAIRQAGDSPFLRTLCWLNALCMGLAAAIAFKFFFLPPLLFSLVPCLAFLGAALTAPREA